MGDEYLIVGDVHGNFKTLMALIAKAPVCPIILAGDLVDRGPCSREVVEWAISTANVTSILGNHDAMMLQYFDNDARWKNQWLKHGGRNTLASYGQVGVPQAHLDWFRGIPLYFETDLLIVTHAPMIDYMGGSFGLDTASKIFIEDWLWNRKPPSKRPQFQIYGHNQNEGLAIHESYGVPYAMCIDTSASDILTAIHWPQRRIYQQIFID